MADKKEFGRRQKRAGTTSRNAEQSSRSGKRDDAGAPGKPGLPKGLGRSIKPGVRSAIKATHTVSEGETLSQIALDYYGSAARADWMAIYEANKETIGDNPSLIKPGQVLQIPER